MIEFKVGESLERPTKEKPVFGDTTLYEFSAHGGGRARLFRDGGLEGPEVRTDWSRSGTSL